MKEVHAEKRSTNHILKLDICKDNTEFKYLQGR